MTTVQDQNTWRRIVAAVRAEYAAQESTERAWLDSRLDALERFQLQLHGFFEKADGNLICRDCGGECCARGKHHLTLVNLLAMLHAGELPPEPDFSSTCPFLGVSGCLLKPSRRPFNCVTFLCEQIESRLLPCDRNAFYALEQELRDCYREFADRYAGAGLRGLMIRAERLGNTPFLSRPGRRNDR